MELRSAMGETDLVPGICTVHYSSLTTLQNPNPPLVFLQLQ